MNLESIANLLTTAETEKASAELLASLKSASVNIKDEIHQRTLERNRFWKTATDIRADAKTRAAAKDGHGDLEMVLATLESAASEIAKATDCVETGIGKVARDKSRQTLDAQREAVVQRLKADWDNHVDALADMLDDLSAAEKATHVHNMTYKDSVSTMDRLLERPAWVGMTGTTPLRKIEVQRIDAARPLRGV